MVNIRRESVVLATNGDELALTKFRTAFGRAAFLHYTERRRVGLSEFRVTHDIEDSFGDFDKQMMGDTEWDAAVGYATDDNEDEDAG
jgi:hypothetical protein